MVHRIAVFLAGRMAGYIGWQDRTTLLTYGMEMFVGESFKFIILIILAAIFKMLTPMLLIMAVTVPLRLTAGGGHLKTFTGCTVASVLVFFSLAFAAKTLIPLFIFDSFMIYFLALLAVSLGVIYLWVPGKNPARSFTESQRARFRRLSMMFVLVWAGSCLLVYAASPDILAPFFVSTSIAVTWQNFMVSPLGYKFLDFANTLLTPNLKEVK